MGTDTFLLVGVVEIVGPRKGAGFVEETRKLEMKAGFDFRVDVDVEFEVNTVAETEVVSRIEVEETEVEYTSGVVVCVELDLVDLQLCDRIFEKVDV